MLARLKHNQQVREFVALCLIGKNPTFILTKELSAKQLEDSKNDLRVYSSHPKRLHERSKTQLNVILSVVLPLKIFFKASFVVFFFTTKTLRNFINLDLPAVKQHFGSCYCSCFLVEIFTDVAEKLLFLNVNFLRKLVCRLFPLAHFFNAGNPLVSLLRVLGIKALKFVA
jgi:hypothetical protein